MYTSANPALTDKIIDYEVGYLTDPTDLVEFFQELIDSGLIDHLQGHYGRTAHTLAEAGLVTL